MSVDFRLSPDLCHYREEDLAALLAPSVDLEYDRNANRTKTPSEALESSLLGILTSNSSSTSSITRQELDEAFCRDTETFSKLLKREASRHRKQVPWSKTVVGFDCQQPLALTTCAVLYDRWGHQQLEISLTNPLT